MKRVCENINNSNTITIRRPKTEIYYVYDKMRLGCHVSILLFMLFGQWGVFPTFCHIGK